MSIAKIIGIVSALALMVGVTAYTEANATSQQLPRADEITSRQSQILFGAAAEASGPMDMPAGMPADAGIAPAPAAAEAPVLGATAPYPRVLNGVGYETNPMVNARTTATGMIGQSVTDLSGKKIATVKDIVLDSTGTAALIVVTDGGFMGMGDKLAALNYNMVVQQRAEGDLMMPLSADSLEQIKPFSYDVKEASDKVRVIPANGYSTVQLLKGKILDPQNKALGDVENVVFRGGKAAQVIVTFDEKLKLGAGRAALNFDDLTLARQPSGAADFRMNERQSAKFEAYKGIKIN